MTSPIVTFNNVVKNINYFQLKIDDLSFENGEIIGIVGEEGSGKTTIIDLLMDLRIPDNGIINRALTEQEESPSTFKSQVGFIYEDLPFYDFAKLSDLSSLMSDVYPTWDQKAFHARTSEFELPLGQKFRDYSQDMRIKTMLAASLAHHPKLLIMDEPMKSLDNKSRFQLFKYLRQINKKDQTTMLITSEHGSTIEKFVQSIIFIHEGEIVLTGRVRDLKKQYKTLDIAYKSAIGGKHK